MTAKQKANIERFKKVVAEAKKLRAKNPKLTQPQAVKQAWAILYKGGKVGESHKDTKSHNVNIRVVSGFPIDFRGTFGKLKFKIVKQFDIYGKINAILEDVNTGKNIVVIDGDKNATQLSEQFFKYLLKTDSGYIDIEDDKKFVVRRMSPFFIQLNKDVKAENKKSGKKVTKKQATKKEVKQTYTKQTGGSNKLYDLRFQAMPPGKRKSATGKTYYEYRSNRSDQGKLLGINGLFDTSIISDIDSLKKEYFKLAKKYHPDAGGTTAQMQQLVSEYESLLKKLLQGSSLNNEQRENELQLDEAMRKVIDELIGLEGLDVQIVGKWIWIGGQTYPVRNELKKAGLIFIKKNGVPYWVYKGVESSGRGKMTIEEIKTKYGAKKVDLPGGLKKITGIKNINKTKLLVNLSKITRSLNKRPI